MALTGSIEGVGLAASLSRSGDGVESPPGCAGVGRVQSPAFVGPRPPCPRWWSDEFRSWLLEVSDTPWPGAALRHLQSQQRRSRPHPQSLLSRLCVSDFREGLVWFHQTMQDDVRLEVLSSTASPCHHVKWPRHPYSTCYQYTEKNKQVRQHGRPGGRQEGCGVPVSFLQLFRGGEC